MNESSTITNLTKTQQRSLSNLKAKLNENDRNDESTLLRFLRAREFDVDGAYRQFVSTKEWRRKNDIDNILKTPRPLSDELKNILSYGFHKFDKEGRPCYIEKTGRMDINAVLRLPEDQLVKWHVWNTEKQIEQMREKSIELNREITTLDHIHDLGGATMYLRKALRLFTRLAKLDQEYYPERVGKIFIVNTPWVFPYFWKMAKSFLDPKTRDKCVVLNSSEMSTMLDYFEPEDLPEEYGGHVGVMEDVYLPYLSICCKKCFTLKIDCNGNNESVFWFYRISSKDIKFGVSFAKREINNTIEKWIIEPDYPLHCSRPNVGFYNCAEAGTYTFVWDNSASRFLSRTLKYHVIVSNT